MRFHDVSIVGCFAACSETLLFAKYFGLSPKPTPSDSLLRFAAKGEVWPRAAGFGFKQACDGDERGLLTTR